MNDTPQKPDNNSENKSTPAPEQSQPTPVPPKPAEAQEPKSSVNINQATITRKPVATATTEETGTMERRSFIKWLTIGWGDRRSLTTIGTTKWGRSDEHEQIRVLRNYLLTLSEGLPTKKSKKEPGAATPSEVITPPQKISPLAPEIQ